MEVEIRDHRSAIWHRRASWPIIVLAWVCILLGIVLLTGGIWLIALGGSWYYAPAGLGLIGTGALLSRRSMAGVWLYLAVWAATLAWAWWEVGDDWWAQLPRLLAPTILLVAIVLCIPWLGRTTTRIETDTVRSP